MTKKKKPEDLLDAGRPEEYTKEYADKLATTIPAMFKNGEDIAEVCVAIGCSKDSYYKMIKISPAFSEAVKEGLTLSEAWWTKTGRRACSGLGKDIQASVWIFSMKNKFGWRDKNEITGADGASLFTEFAKAVNESGKK